MRTLAIALVAALLVGSAHSQTVDNGAVFGELLSKFTGGTANVTSGAEYLYGLGTGLANGFQSTLTELYNSFLNNTAKEAIEDLVDRYQEEFCTNATYTPAEKIPASFTGPGFSLSISAGACVFNQTAFALGGEVQIDCVGPSVVKSQTPATLRSASKTPETFTSSYCSVTTTIDDKIDAKLNATVSNITASLPAVDLFGKPKAEPSTEILFVFDNKPDIIDFNAIGQQLQAEFESILGTVNTVLASGAGSQVGVGLQSSLGQQAQAAIGNITGAAGPSVDFLIDGLVPKILP